MASFSELFLQQISIIDHFGHVEVLLFQVLDPHHGFTEFAFHEVLAHLQYHGKGEVVHKLILIGRADDGIPEFESIREDEFLR